MLCIDHIVIKNVFLFYEFLRLFLQKNINILKTMPLFFSFVCHFNWYWKLQFQSVIIVYIRIQLLGGIKSIISIIKLRRDVHKVFFNSLFCLLILIRARKYLTKPLEKKKNWCELLCIFEMVQNLKEQKFLSDALFFCVLLS